MAVALSPAPALEPTVRRGPAVRLEGGLLGPDILERLQEGALPGQKPADFNLSAGRSLVEEIAAVFQDARDLYHVFRRGLDRLLENDPATTLTRERWMIPFLGLLGYELRYNSRSYELGGQLFAVSHRAGENEDAPPVHIVGARRSLDRVDPSGRPRVSPHALLQEFLNRSDHLWGIVTNGLELRLLRRSTLLRRQAYVAFDLEAIFEEERFIDFVLLYRLLHRTRLPKGIEDAPTCWLERYHEQAVEQGNRARDRLRDGVEKCLILLANGFLRHRPATESVRAEELYRDLLRLVYRFLFLLVTEERGLLSGNDLYREHYSITRLKRLVDRREAYTNHDDLWCGLRVLWHLLRDSTPVLQADGKPLASLLGLPVLDGGLFEDLALESWTISNRDLLEAFRHLVYYYDEETHTLRRVNYAALDVEELGSVYESLLDNHPVILDHSAGKTFDFAQGTERRSTGSYYTPEDLVAELVRSALEPAITERLEWAQRVARGEWRAVRNEIHQLLGEAYARSILSRLRDLAESHGTGRAGIRSYQSFPSRGEVRINGPDAPSRSVDPREHRRGMGEKEHPGIPPISQHRIGEPSGAGDLRHARPKDRFDETGTDSTPARPDPDFEPSDRNASTPSEKAIDEVWNALPLATRPSLLAEHALLSLRVLDPACGSGHFLLAAARRLGRELARVRTGEDEPSPEALREAVRDVIAHCIYGVDKNPLAVELCKVALWIETQVPGKPLTFLDHRIRCGDSLVGVFDPKVLWQGIPDEAYDRDRSISRTRIRALKERNQRERAGQRALDLGTKLEEELLESAVVVSDLEGMPDDSAAAVAEKARRYRELQNRLERQRLACDLWTAAFFWDLTGGDPPTTDAVRRALENPSTLRGDLAGRARELAERHRFFHWPLEFPEVFVEGGFDLVLSNPPWERIKLQEEEFFATRAPEIANAPNKAARQRLIQELPERNPALWREYQESLHAADATSRFLRYSGRFPLTGRGDINTYAVFAELTRRLLKPTGRAGIIVPTGIATDATTQHFFSDLMERRQLASLYDFENRKKLFPAIDSRMKFCLLTLTGPERPAKAAEFAFFCHETRDLQDPERRFTLSPEDLRLVNPNTRTAPIFRSRRDAELTKHIYRRVPVLIKEASSELRVASSEEGRPLATPHSPFAESNPWGVEFLAMFHMANDSHLFRTKEELEAQGFRLEGNVFVRGAERYLPLYEAKMVHQFDHRFGDYRDQPPGRESTQLPEVPVERLADPNYVVLPRYWVPEEEVEARLTAKGWDRGWLLGWRDITNVTNERTVIAAVIPRVGVGHKFLLMFPVLPKGATLLVAALDSLPFDYCARQKLGGTSLTYFTMKQLPVLPPGVFDRPCPWSPRETLADWIRPRVLELTYTAWDLKPFADDLWVSADEEGRQAMLQQWRDNQAVLHGGRNSEEPLAARGSLLADNPLPPFRYDPERRFQLRCELDAAFFLLYLGTPEEWEREATPELKALFPTPAGRRRLHPGPVPHRAAAGRGTLRMLSHERDHPRRIRRAHQAEPPRVGRGDRQVAL
jgi:hypothetical protein